MTLNYRQLKIKKFSLITIKFLLSKNVSLVERTKKERDNHLSFLDRYFIKRMYLTIECRWNII